MRVQHLIFILSLRDCLPFYIAWLYSCSLDPCWLSLLLPPCPVCCQCLMGSWNLMSHTTWYPRLVHRATQFSKGSIAMDSTRPRGTLGSQRGCQRGRVEKEGKRKGNIGLTGNGVGEKSENKSETSFMLWDLTIHIPGYIHNYTQFTSNVMSCELLAKLNR